MGFFIRGKIPAEEKNPINRLLVWVYHPVIDFVIKWRWPVVLSAGTLIVWVFFPWNSLAARLLPDGPTKEWALKVGKIFPYQNLGSEFLPPLYEGDLLYMPTTFPGISPTKAREVLQTTDKLIRRFPEVHHVFGKVGRAETATDPAPFDMIETTIMLKPEEEWPAVDIKDEAGKIIAHRRRTSDELVDALNAAVQIPGLNNAWTMPIKTRIDMLATGIKTPVGIKVAGSGSGRIGANRLRDRGGGQGRARHSQRLCRTHHGWQLHPVHHRPQSHRPVRPEHRRRAGRAGGGPRRHAADHHRRGIWSVTPSISATAAISAKTSGRCARSSCPHPPGRKFRSASWPRSRPSTPRWASRARRRFPTPGFTLMSKAWTSATYVQMAMRAVNEAVAKGAIKLPSGYNIFWSGQYEYMHSSSTAADDRRPAHPR